MPRGRLRIPAAVLLLVLAPPCGRIEAMAGLVTYDWAPLVGYGYFVNPEGQFIPISTYDGKLTIGYDPDSLWSSYIDFSTGSSGFGADSGENFTVSVSHTGVTFSAIFGLGGVVTASIAGDPGPLNSKGDPESLNSLLGDPVSVHVSPSYHGDQLWFSAQSVPEPSSLLTLTLGLGGVSLAYVARRMKQRPGPRGHANRPHAIAPESPAIAPCDSPDGS